MPIVIPYQLLNISSRQSPLVRDQLLVPRNVPNLLPGANAGADGIVFYTVSVDHAALFTLTVVLMWCYFSLRTARTEQDSRIEYLVLREINNIDLGSGSPASRKTKRPGVTQEEIDRSMCSFKMSANPGAQGTRKTCMKILSCKGCGVTRPFDLKTETETCSICLSELQDGARDKQDVRVLPECGHGMLLTASFRMTQADPNPIC